MFSSVLSVQFDPTPHYEWRSSRALPNCLVIREIRRLLFELDQPKQQTHQESCINLKGCALRCSAHRPTFWIVNIICSFFTELQRFLLSNDAVSYPILTIIKTHAVLTAPPRTPCSILSPALGTLFLKLFKTVRGNYDGATESFIGYKLRSKQLPSSNYRVCIDDLYMMYTFWGDFW